MQVRNALDVGATGANITTSASSASATIPNASDGNLPKFCAVSVTAAAHIRWGKGAQTAVATDLLINVGVPVIIRTAGSDTIAAIQDAAAGKVTVTPLEWIA